MTDVYEHMFDTEITFFPGRDYPDREVWLAKRYTPRNLLRDRVFRTVYFPEMDERGRSKPMVIGTNAAKRVLSKRVRQSPKLRGTRVDLVRERHAFNHTSVDVGQKDTAG